MIQLSKIDKVDIVGKSGSQMNRKMRKVCVRILLCVILSGCAENICVYAAEEEVSNTPVPSDGQEYGILVIECINGGGVIELSSGDFTATSNCDYYEVEVPMEKEIIITVHPKPIYEVGRVRFGNSILKPEDGRYRVIMMKPFMTLSLTYKAASNDNSGNDGSSASESVDNKVHHSDSSLEQEESVSSISYDVEVRYLETADGEVTDIASASENSSDVMVLNADVQEVSAYMADDEDLDNNTADTEAVYATDVIPVEETDLEPLEKISESIESADTDVEMEKEDIILVSASGAAAGQERILVNSKEEFGGSLNAEEKSVLILSNFPLYLVLVCCMILVKRLNWMKKVEIDG